MANERWRVRLAGSLAKPTFGVVDWNWRVLELLGKQISHVLVPPDLHKLTLVAHPSMTDDLHSYLIPLLLKLFQILNACLNRVFEEFVHFIFHQLIESLQG
jgi:hypothetical protein